MANGDAETHAAGMTTTAIMDNVSNTTDKCNLSVASTPTHLSGKSSSVGSGGRTRRITFPASPALSTLSKNTSSSASGSSSFASAAKMSVDDILSSSKISLGARQNARRTMAQKSSSVLLVKHGKTNPKSNASQQSQSSHMNHRQDEFQRQMGQDKVHPPSLQKTASSKQKNQQQSNPSLFPKIKESLQTNESISNVNIHTMHLTQTPSSCRSTRVQTDMLNFQSSSALMISVPPSVDTEICDDKKRSNYETKNGAEECQNDGQTTTANQNKPVVMEDTTKKDPVEVDDPESAQKALAILLDKYDGFISSRANNKIEGGESINSGDKSTSPWSIIQSLVPVLSHLNLFDPNAQTSEDCRNVEIGFSQLLKSSNKMRWEVMNRNRDDSNDGITSTFQDEGHLVQLIQIQIWIRMMVWSLERDAGWEFLLRGIALSDAKWIQAKDKGVPKKTRGKKRKKGEQKRLNEQNHTSARDSLVHDLRQLMELAPYVLPASLNFSVWLKDTLTFGFRQPLPEYGSQIFEFFEIEVADPIALKRSGTNSSQESDRSEVFNSSVKSHEDDIAKNDTVHSNESPTKQLMEKRQKSQQAYFTSLMETGKNGSDDESATVTGSFSTVTTASRASSLVRDRVDPLLLKTSVSLTAVAPAQTSNPFLKSSARGVYVGSHLGSKLSNITSLFREVKAPAKPVVQTKEKTTNTSIDFKRVATRADLEERPKPKATRSTKTLSSPPGNETPFKKTRLAMEETPIRSIIDETPAKRLHPTARTRLRLHDDMSNAIVAETPQHPSVRWRSQGVRQHTLPSQNLHNSVIAATPLQQTIRGGSSAALSSHRPDFQQSLPKPRKPFFRPNHASGLGALNKSDHHNQQHHHTPVNNSRHTLPLNSGLSPMPNHEDMAQVMAKVAKSVARKEGTR